MTPDRLIRLVAQTSLFEGRPLGPDLEALGTDQARRAARIAQSGQLEQALHEVGFPPDLARVGAQWPRALRPASHLVEQLPSPSALRFDMGGLLLLVAFVGFFELSVNAVLERKAMPVFARLLRDGGVSLTPWGPALGVAALVLGATFVMLLMLETRRGRLSGWQHHLEVARQASLVLALDATQAPEDVRAAQLRGSQHLVDLPASTPAMDLDAIRADAVARAEAAFGRVAGVGTAAVYVALALGALSVAIDVFRTLAVLPSLF